MHSDFQQQEPQKSASLFTTGQLAAIKPQTRLGSVPYLNARPLHWMIREPVKFLDPSLLSAELAAGKLHAGLIPVFAILENADAYHVVDGYAIGSLNIVYSVVMSHTLPVVRVKSVALDPASRTSNHLVRILLEKYYRIKPVYLSPDEIADAQVMIGDPAIAYRQSHPDERYLDLSQSWHSHTGLPFVFAAWAVRRDAPDVKGIARQLRSAAVLGLNERHVIARSPFEYRYLTENLYYHLGTPQKRAIDAFAADLFELGLLARRPELSYI
jgi:predicted solute-binding protein